MLLHRARLAKLTSRQLGPGINEDWVACSNTRRCSQIDAVCRVWIEASHPLDPRISVVRLFTVLQSTEVQIWYYQQTSTHWLHSTLSNNNLPTNISLLISIAMQFFVLFYKNGLTPSVLWHCWLGGRKGIRPVTNMKWWGAGMVICLERGANDLHMVQLMLLLPLSSLASAKSGMIYPSATGLPR